MSPNVDAAPFEPVEYGVRPKYLGSNFIRADLHIHTDRSDGLVSAAEVVRLAHAAGLDTIAVTDHDAVGGLAPAAETAAQLGVRLVPGVEMTADVRGHEVHLLAYFQDAKPLLETGQGTLQAFLNDVQAARKERIRTAVRALRTRGFFVTEADVFGAAKSESYGRLHLARALKNAGYVNSENEAFSRVLNTSAVPTLAVDPAAVTRIVHEFEGKVVWAHPDTDEYRRHIDTLVGAGIDGVETHNFRRRELVGALTPAVRERGLLETGGSDWHGGPNERPLGTDALADDLAEPFLEALHRRAA